MIYLDHAATAPLDERVFEAMLPFLRPGGIHGNPSSDLRLGARRRRRWSVRAGRWRP